MPSLGVDQTQHLETSALVYYITLQTPHISVESAKRVHKTNVMMQTVHSALHSVKSAKIVQNKTVCNALHSVTIYNQQHTESMVQDRMKGQGRSIHSLLI